jgi:hypothetical protein
MRRKLRFFFLEVGALLFVADSIYCTAHLFRDCFLHTLFACAYTRLNFLESSREDAVPKG